MNSPQAFVTGNGDQRRTLVVVFLRGGADGLSLVAPVEDDDYYRARPRLALSKAAALKLDGFFGLNPLLKELHALYQEGTMAIVHCAGSEDDTRSHFEAQDLMEHGGLNGGGWLGRFLRSRHSHANLAGAAPDRPRLSALSAVALGSELPESFRGAPAVSVMQSVEDFSIGSTSAALVPELERLYGLESDFLGQAGRDTIDALRRIEKLRSTRFQAENGAMYGNDGFAQGLRQIARLIKARVGLEAASLDLGGWDSHFTQGTLIEPLMVKLARGLAAFRQDLGRWMESTTVVCMTEFGRRVRENASFGTDHGRGSVMLVMGGGVRGGRVIGTWPGLKIGVLEGPGDLPVKVNYRNVLAPILARNGARDLERIFPHFKLEPVAF